MRIRLLLSMCMLVVTIIPAFTQDANPPAGGMTPEMRQRMTAFMQDMLIMMQNTAVETPQGIVVLQGNRLLFFSNTDMSLRRTLALPVPPAPAAGTGGAIAAPLRSMVPAKLLVQGNGEIVVVRGQQLVRVSRDLATVMNTGTIPNLPALTPAEVAIVAPLATQIAMMPMMMGMGMPGMPPHGTAGGGGAAPVAAE